MARIFRITLLRAKTPPEATADINKELQWFCTSLGLVGNRDKNLSTFRIFIVLLKARQKGNLLSSDSIAHETGLTRATVIHHLTKLASSGVVMEDHERYRLTVDNMEELVKHLHTEIEQSMRELEHVSKRIDEKLGLR
jgi:predicted transcriptional regulator